MNQLMQDIPLTIFGDGMQTRAFSYIGDIAPHIARCVANEKALNQIINIGADQEYTVKELAEEVCVAMGKEGSIRYLDARNEVMHAYSDHSKAKSIFGESHQTTLKEGLTKMAEWAWKTGSKSSAEFGEIEIEENLPPSWRKTQAS